jgi:hypothetical protein
LPVHDASAWSQVEKDGAIDWVFDHPHRFTTEDVRWAGQYLGLDPQACRAVFRNAPKLGVVSALGLPVYIFAIPDNRIMSTASEERLDSLRLPMTKDLMRWSRSPEGRDMLSGAIGHVEESDIRNGSVRTRWLEAIGFRRQPDLIEFRRQRFIRFQFEG